MWHSGCVQCSCVVVVCVNGDRIWTGTGGTGKWERKWEDAKKIVERLDFGQERHNCMLHDQSPFFALMETHGQCAREFVDIPVQDPVFLSKLPFFFRPVSHPSDSIPSQE
jgi:hypothetical protein